MLCGVGYLGESRTKIVVMCCGTLGKLSWGGMTVHLYSAELFCVFVFYGVQGEMSSCDSSLAVSLPKAGGHAFGGVTGS